jgi:hypothetical protein
MSYVSVREQRLIVALRGIQKSAPGGVHTYRICSNNLMIAANVPLATRMWFHNCGQAKASALSEIIYRRLLQNDIQYHQAIIARTLFTFVTAAKRHIAA